MKTQETETNARRLMNTVTASLCPVLLAGATILFAPGTGISQTTEPGPPKPVKIINTGSEPVPVQGSVAVTGNVNLVDKQVIVANSELAPVQVRDIHRKPTTPLHVLGEILFDVGEPLGIKSKVIYTVPAGKRLVIEFIAAEVSKDGSSPNFRGTIQAAANLGGGMLHFPLAFTPLNNEFRLFNFTGMTKIYAGDETNVVMNFSIGAPATNQNRFTLRFSGYLEDL